MNKTQIIKILDQAIPEHIDWVRQGRRLLKGIPQNQIKTPQDCKGKNFGEWHAAEGYKLVNIPQLANLDTLHQAINKKYTALYYMTFDRRKQARSTLITANDIEVPVEEKQFREKKLKDLETDIIKIIKGLKVVKQKVELMKEADFESGWLV